MHRIKRYHDICAGHRVAGHEGKCQHLHGHNYRVHFTCEADARNVDGLDDLGRVIDFSQVKALLCEWLETHWDHKFLAWEHDPVMKAVYEHGEEKVRESIVWVPFNPTAENMAAHLVNVVGVDQLAGTGIVLTEVTIEETAKCSATYTR